MKLLFATLMVLVYANIVISYRSFTASERKGDIENPEHFIRMCERVTALFVAAYTLAALLIAYRWNSVLLSALFGAFLILDGIHTVYHIQKRTSNNDYRRNGE